MTSCHVCGWEADVTEGEWMELGTIGDKLSADMAKEALTARGIPAVVFSQSGFFGDAGLSLYPFFKSKAPQFVMKVPAVYGEEAAEVLDMIIGNNWQRKDT
ncbi:MAG: hypothetical protein OEW00_11915 [candidate division Zixibacteria bacterium]|nr:hypothetical protein [candidate division Zixibacteria bacterium]